MYWRYGSQRQVRERQSEEARQTHSERVARVVYYALGAGSDFEQATYSFPRLSSFHTSTYTTASAFTTSPPIRSSKTVVTLTNIPHSDGYPYVRSTRRGALDRLKTSVCRHSVRKQQRRRRILQVDQHLLSVRHSGQHQLLLRVRKRAWRCRSDRAHEYWWYPDYRSADGRYVHLP